MYLSRLILNPRSAEVRRDLASPYDLHRTLKRGYPPDAEPGDNRMLFRVERDLNYNRHRIAVMVQTLVAPPDWSRLPDGYCVDVNQPQKLDLSFSRGQQLAFRLDANAVVKRQRANDRTSRDRARHSRIALTDEEAQRHWLLKRAEGKGFGVLYLDAVPYMVGDGNVPTNEDKTTIPHFGVRFSGLLEVRDPDQFLRTVRNGIGPAKAFGFGMMALARPV